jgi:hypothetical protein
MPEVGEEAELEELDEVEAFEESQPDGFGSHTIAPRGELGQPSGSDRRDPSQRSRALLVALGVALVGALALGAGRELGSSRRVAPRAEPKQAAAAVIEPAPPQSQRPHSPPSPGADDLPLLPPGIADAPSAAPASEVADTKASAPPEAPNAAVVAVSPDAVSVSAANPVLALPATAGTRPAEPPEMGAFDPSVADAAIGAAFQRARGCRSAGDTKGIASVTLTYAPSGRVTTALVSGTFAGTPVGSCIAAMLRSARIEPFTGALVTVKRSALLD